MKEPLSITGVGVVSPLGSSRASLFTSLANAAREPGAAFGPPTMWEPGNYPGACVAEVPNFDPTPVLGDKGLRNLDRLTKFFLVAASDALEDAGIKRDGAYIAYSGPKVGVCASTAYGSLEAMMELNRVAEIESPRYLNPSKFPNTVINAALGYVSIWHDLRALNATVCNGNCGALDAVLCAETYLASRRAGAILVGGAEAMHEALYLAFSRLESLATVDRAHRPGHLDSQGMRLGEGSMLAVLERNDAARARGARILGDVVGYGTSFEPPESEAMLVHVHPDPIAKAIEWAVADAGITYKDIDLVVSCANGVVLYDAAEREALARTVGNDVCTVTPKSFFGETLGADGAFAIAAALAWMAGAPLGPMARGKVPDRLQYVLITALGFYGNASAIVIRRPD